MKPEAWFSAYLPKTEPIDAFDGRTQYADIGQDEGLYPVCSIVHVSDVSVGARRVEKTVADIAAAHDGRYSVEIHLRHDPTTTEAFAQTHVRRLEAIRRATGGVERQADGSWRIAPDHLDKVLAYERERARARPVMIEMLSAVPIERQLGADGATWRPSARPRNAS